MEPAEHLEALRADLDRIRATPPEALASPVAACPGWTVADLLAHHAGVLAFATAQLRAEPGSDIVPFDPPPDGDPLVVFGSAADALLVELIAVEPTEPRPSWAGPTTASFWFRRMAQEAAVHRWDAQAAYGEPAPIDTGLALDGIDELFEIFLPHAKARGITGTGETVHLHATDDGLAEGAGEWTLTFHAEGISAERSHGKAQMAARGPAAELLLLVWNRRPVRVETFGEPDLPEWWARKVRI